MIGQSMIGYDKKLARVLEAMGGLYTLDDILTRIANGRMQSHVVGNSWAITEINAYPRRRQVQVVAVVGDLADVPKLNDKVLDFAREVEVDLVATLGRKGWLKTGQACGWRLKAKTYLWQREL